MKIKNYISKDLVIGAIGGSILATIITSIIDTKAVEKANDELELSNDEFEKKFEEDLEKMNNQEEVIEAQGLKIQELEDELKSFDEEDYRQWKNLRHVFHIEKDAFYNWLKEKREKEEKEKEIEEVKQAIKEKDWSTVYNKAEGWYNKYPVQMSRSEVFTNLEKDEYITQEERTEAYNYFGSLWNYVGD